MKLVWYQPQLVALNIQGPDATDFLHRLTTQDFNNFTTNQEKYAAFLEPNSAIKHLFLVQKTSAESFNLWTLSKRVQQLKEDLEKFHFAEKLTFEIKEEPPRVVHGELNESERVDSGLFSLSVDVKEKNLLLEIPFDDFLASQKGCYPGQEVVERIFTYGKVAKKLILIDLERFGKNIIGNEVMFEGKKIGDITSMGSKKAFAYLQKPYFENPHFSAF